MVMKGDALSHVPYEFRGLRQPFLKKVQVFLINPMPFRSQIEYIKRMCLKNLVSNGGLVLVQNLLRPLMEP